MWLLTRLILLILGFIIRLYNKTFLSLDLKTSNGIRYHEHTAKNKAGELVAHSIFLPIKNNYYFKLTREKGIDKFFKSIGFSQEFQTGHKNFDDEIYITSDHPFIYELLQTNLTLQNHILEIFTNNVSHITNNGSWLYLSSRSQLDLDSTLIQLKSVLDILEKDTLHQHSRLKDRFFYKALVIESLIWSIGFYSFGSLSDFIFHHTDLHLQLQPIINLGLEIYVVALILLALLIKFILSGSSRGHRIFIESALVFILCLPIACMQAVSDLNIYLDLRPTIIKDIKILGKWSEYHSGRRYRYHSYHIKVAPEPSLPQLPEVITVDHTIYDSIDYREANNEEGQLYIPEYNWDYKIPIEFGSGYFNIPWYKKINNIVVGQA